MQGDFAEVLNLGFKEFAIVQVLGLATAAKYRFSDYSKGAMREDLQETFYYGRVPFGIRSRGI